MSSFASVSVKSKQDDVEEWENHIVLRVPNNVVDRMNKVVNGNKGAEDLGIHIGEDNRHVEIKLGTQILPAKILDLPTITEVHKTLDNAVLYKVADVSQIIMCDEAMPVSKKERRAAAKSANSLHNEVVKAEVEPATISQFKPVAKSRKQLAREKVREFQFPHGLVPPMKNVRKKRFRMTKQKKLMGVGEIETALKRLLRDDLEATSVHWEIVEADGSTPQEGEWEEEYDADDGDSEADDEKDESPDNDQDKTEYDL